MHLFQFFREISISIIEISKSIKEIETGISVRITEFLNPHFYYVYVHFQT